MSCHCSPLSTSSRYRMYMHCRIIFRHVIKKASVAEEAYVSRLVVIFSIEDRSILILITS